MKNKKIEGWVNANLDSDPIITPNEWCEDEKELRLSQCHSIFQDYYNGPESLHAMGCINAVYVSDGMVVYPDGTTDEA